MRKLKKSNAGTFFKKLIVILSYKENLPSGGVITKGSSFESDWTLEYIYWNHYLYTPFKKKNDHLLSLYSYCIGKDKKEF